MGPPWESDASTAAHASAETPVTRRPRRARRHGQRRAPRARIGGNGGTVTPSGPGAGGAAEHVPEGRARAEPTAGSEGPEERERREKEVLERLPNVFTALPCPLRANLAQPCGQPRTCGKPRHPNE
ncbi:hypothetical protein GCM10022227_53340 [Streptomyces sedi]